MAQPTETSVPSGTANVDRSGFSAPSTDLLASLLASKPHLFSPDPVANWRKAWNLVISDLTTMHRLGENYAYNHVRTGAIMCGKDDEINEEFARFEREGWVRHEGQTYHAVVPHPKLKKSGLRAVITPVCYSHPKKNVPLCPLMFGLNELFGCMTYLRVEFSVVPLTKSDMKITLDLVNGKY